MAMATKSIIVSDNVTTAATHHAKCSGPKPADDEPVSPPFSAKLRRVCYSFEATAWRVRRDPQDLAFVAATASLLTVLLACLRRAERLTLDSPAAERRSPPRSAASFAYRVAAVMPAPLVVLVWCMTAFVALVELYLLVLCRDQQYHCRDQQYQARDAKASAKMIGSTDELV